MDNIREGRFCYENLLELMPVASNENANIMPLLSHDDVYHPYYTPAANIEMPPFPPSLFQQPSLNSYKDYFVETSVPQLQGDMPLLPYSDPEAASGFNLAGLSFGTYAPKEKGSSVSNSRELADAPKYSRKSHDPIARQRATSADRFRKVKNAEKVEALQKLLPHPKKVGKTEQVDQIIDYIKYLQLQIKDLSQSRLGAEPTSPFIFLEGYGHYFVHELMMSKESLEEAVGKLLETTPLEANHLLKSRGLFVMPMHLAQSLQQSNFM